MKAFFSLYLLRLLKVLGMGLLALVVGVGAVAGWETFQGRAVGERRERMESSPWWRDGKFQNPQPLTNDFWGMVTGIFKASPYRTPTEPLPVAAPDHTRFDIPPASGLRATWLGHSTSLVEIDGYRVLVDPMWGDRSSPVGFSGPKRWYAPPLPLDKVPRVHAVVISHDHYDHLDQGTITAIKDWDTRFIVPLGTGAHLARWGVPESRITELDWWEQTRVGELAITCTPARHSSGRVLFDKDTRLWAGFALTGPGHRVYYSGDSGMFPALRDIGERLGPFDLTLIEVGAYGRSWPDWHMGPEQAVAAHQMVRGRVMLPVHWGMLNLSYHGWTEPIERVLAAAGQSGVKIAAPQPGGSIEPDALPETHRWWQDTPWNTAEQDPIVSTQVN